MKAKSYEIGLRVVAVSLLPLVVIGGALLKDVSAVSLTGAPVRYALITAGACTTLATLARLRLGFIAAVAEIVILSLIVVLEFFVIGVTYLFRYGFGGVQ